MRELRPFALVLFILPVLGCTNGHGFTGSLSANLIGVVAKAEPAGCSDCYALASSTKTTIASKTIERSISAYEALETEQYPLVDISQTVAGRLYDYKVVFGPNFGSSTEADGYVKSDTGKPPCFFVDNGWAFFWGGYPMAYTTWVDAASDGTSFLVQEVDATKQRVFLLEGTKVDVACQTGGDTERVESLGVDGKGMYVEVVSGIAGCDVLDPKNVKDAADGTEVEEFVEKAAKVAHAAGWPGTTGYPAL